MNTLEKLWTLYSVVPRDIPDDRRSEMHVAFYAGAEAVLHILWEIGEMDEEEGMTRIDSLHEECREIRQERYEAFG